MSGKSQLYVREIVTNMIINMNEERMKEHLVGGYRKCLNSFIDVQEISPMASVAK